MATILKTKNSVTTTVVPTTLQQGELAVNITDKKMWVGNAATTPVQIVGAGATNRAGGSNTQVQYNSSGDLAGSANMTFSGTALTLANDASISGLTVGKGGGAVATNTAVGTNALAANTSGDRNTGIGLAALQNNTTGYYNSAVGYAALNANTSGYQNAAFGYYSLGANTTGTNNTSFGYNALQANTTASNNTAVGYQAGYTTNSGVNSYFGHQAGYYQTDVNDSFGYRALYGASGSSGYYNVAMGHSSLLSNTSGQSNTAIGRQSLQANTTGSASTAVGYQAAYTNTTGGLDAFGYRALLNNTTGTGSSAFGISSLQSNTTGAYNTAVGQLALNANTTASNNTAVGYQAGYSNTTALYSTYVGMQAGYNTTGERSTFVGMQAGYNITTGLGNTILGRYNGNQGGLDIRTSNYNIVLSDGDGNPNGSCDNTGAWNFGLGTRSLDGIIFSTAQSGANLGPVLIGRTGALNSTTTRWYVGSNSWVKGGTAYDTLICAAGAAGSGGVNLTSGATSWASASDERLKNVTGLYTNALTDIAQIKPVKFTWKSDAENKPQVGVIAQSVIGVVPESVDSNVRTSKEDETEYMSVRYTELIPLMIASIQELNAKVEAQALEIATLKAK